MSVVYSGEEKNILMSHFTYLKLHAVTVTKNNRFQRAIHKNNLYFHFFGSLCHLLNNLCYVCAISEHVLDHVASQTPYKICMIQWLSHRHLYYWIIKLHFCALVTITIYHCDYCRFVRLRISISLSLFVFLPYNCFV